MVSQRQEASAYFKKIKAMSKYSFSLIFACGLLLLSLTGCEKTAVQTPDKQLANPVAPRSVECEGYTCPDDDDCCCGVWLQNISETASLFLCGTSDGDNACTVPEVGDCPEAGGLSQTIYLDSNNFREGFCVTKGTTFYIRNMGSSNANIRLTCQHDWTAPQILTLSIAPGWYVQYSANGICYLTDCYQ